jgi:hypothetical protein
VWLDSIPGRPQVSPPPDLYTTYPLETLALLSHARSVKFAVRRGPFDSGLREPELGVQNLRVDITARSSPFREAAHSSRLLSVLSASAVGPLPGLCPFQPGTPVRAEIALTPSKQRTGAPPARYTTRGVQYGRSPASRSPARLGLHAEGFRRILARSQHHARSEPFHHSTCLTAACANAPGKVQGGN